MSICDVCKKEVSFWKAISNDGLKYHEECYHKKLDTMEEKLQKKQRLKEIKKWESAKKKIPKPKYYVLKTVLGIIHERGTCSFCNGTINNQQYALTLHDKTLAHDECYKKYVREIISLIKKSELYNGECIVHFEDSGNKICTLNVNWRLFVKKIISSTSKKQMHLSLKGDVVIPDEQIAELNNLKAGLYECIKRYILDQMTYIIFIYHSFLSGYSKGLDFSILGRGALNPEYIKLDNGKWFWYKFPSLIGLEIKINKDLTYNKMDLFGKILKVS